MKQSHLAVPTAAACLTLMFSGCTNGSADAEPGESTSLTTEPTGPSPSIMAVDEAAALAVINEAYAAFNSGDAKRWATARSAGLYESEEARDAEVAEATQFFEERIAAGVQFTKIQCVSRGDGLWPGIAGPQAPAVEGYYFTCQHNDGSGDHVTKWLVADGKIVAAGSD